MRETHFIRQNREKWERFELILKQDKKDPDELMEIFIHVTEDLSYARTFYPNRSVRLYLNNLAQNAFINIHKRKKHRFSGFIDFWKSELPQQFYMARFEFLVSFLIFLLAVMIGVISTANQSDFTSVILGEEYVKMTLKNIQKGDPMAVYKSEGALNMFFGITLNNLIVAFRTFLMGVLMMVGTVAILFYNGIMVGTFQYFFYQQGLLIESFSTIWLHGTLEIASIIIAGAAGITLGKGLVFPGTYSRLQAFQITAVRGLKIMIGITPIFIMAAFIEGFITRYTEVPLFIKLMLIAASLLFVIGYFVWYPIQCARKGITIKDFKLPAGKKITFDFSIIKANTEIFSFSFIFFKKHFKKIITCIVLPAIIYSISALSIVPIDKIQSYNFVNALISNLLQYFNYNEHPYFMLFNVLIFSIITLAVFHFLNVEEKGRKAAKIDIKKYIIPFMSILVINALGHLFFFPLNFFSRFLLFLLIPVLALWAFITFKERIGVISSLHRLIFLLKGNIPKLMGIYLMSAIVSVMIIVCIDAPLAWFYIEVLHWNLSLSAYQTGIVFYFIFILLAIISIGTAISFILTCIGLLYFSLIEIKEANHLRENVDKLSFIQK